MSELKPALRRLFGFEDFRPGQEQVVRAAVDGRDTLALMPTGSGKSLTYQLAAMLRPTPTLVLSPLIALMKDQVDKLPPEVAAQATLINSSLDPDEAAARLRGGGRGPLPAPLRRTRAASAAALPRRDLGDRHRPRRDRRGALRQHVGARLPARLPLHPPRPRRARPARDPRHDRDGDARDGAGDRGRSRPGARDRAHERRPAEPALRRRDRRRRGGPPAHARAAAARPPRRVGDRLRPLATELRDAGAHAPRPRSRRRPLPRRARAAGALGRAGGLHRGADPDRRRDDRVRDGHRQAGHPARRPLQLPRVARELRPDGRPRRAATAARRTRCCSRAAPTRASCGGSRAPTSRRSPIFAPSTRGCAAGARCCPRKLGRTNRIRASSSGCWSRSGSCSAASTPAGRCRSRCPTRPPTPPSGSTASSPATSRRR